MKSAANKSENPECTCENCSCNPCTCSRKSCCSNDGKSCCYGGNYWVGSTFRIVLVILLIVGAYAYGVWNGIEHREGYDRDGYGYKNTEGGMMRHGGMMGQYDERDDDRRAGAVPVKMMGMMGGSGESMSDRMMEMSMANMSQMLEGKTGDDLNKSFLEAMIPHHQAAVDMAKYLAASNKPELVKLGADIISAQTKEIEQMQQWMKDWGYTSTGLTHTGILMNPSMMR